jgi:uncharacterized membrane protein
MQNTVENGKKAAIVSYITIIGAVIAIFMNDEKKNAFASFHIRQALGIFITFFASGFIVSYFDNWTITYAYWIFYFVLWFYGFAGALAGHARLVPLLGSAFQKLFKNL